MAEDYASDLRSSAFKKENEGKTTLVSRNITVLGRRTSVRLEPEMWMALREIAAREQCTMHDICTLISVRKNPRTSLTGAIRVFLMLYFRAASTGEGHMRAGHGNFENMKSRAKIPAHYMPAFSKRRDFRIFDGGEFSEFDQNNGNLGIGAAG